MDEYIKREDAIKALCEGCNDRFSDEPCEPPDCEMRNAINSIRAADVAPKSEVAREIFALIFDRLLTSFPAQSFVDAPCSTHNRLLHMLDELKKKYTEVENGTQ